MGCGGSKEADVTAEEVQPQVEELGGEQGALDANRINLSVEEKDAVETKPGDRTFISTVLKARAEAADDVVIMTSCVTRLQAYNSRLKEFIAIYDCETVHEAMNGGFMGLGCNDNKLIAALCSRTKSQLQKTRKRYRTKYDKDLREEVMGETGGSYQRLMYFALASRDQYIADVIDYACHAGVLEMGCNEKALLEVFVTRSQSELQAGKKKWEGRTDKSLVDFLNSELGSSYRHLNQLLQLLYMGDVNGDKAKVDVARCQEQATQLHEECAKGWFEDFDESAIITILGGNSARQNQKVAALYEKTYGASLGKALKGQCGPRLHDALCALLMPKEEFIAMRLHEAMEGWGSDKYVLTRLLGGLDGGAMTAVVKAYEKKYDRVSSCACVRVVASSAPFMLPPSLARSLPSSLPHVVLRWWPARSFCCSAREPARSRCGRPSRRSSQARPTSSTRLSPG